jgi:lysophospholipase L1-like esterase
MSPAAPVYDPASENITRPSAIERYQKDMIDWRPELAVFAYGMNDVGCAHEPTSFLSSYHQIVGETRRALPDALLLLVSPYWNIFHEPDAFGARLLKNEQRGETEQVERMNYYMGIYGGSAMVAEYREGIETIAHRYGGAYVDVYSVLEGSPWFVHDDNVHFNDVGQAVIGMTVFASLASRCSFLSAASARAEHELESSVFNTGGTNSMVEVYRTWHRPEPSERAW